MCLGVSLWKQCQRQKGIIQVNAQTMIADCASNYAVKLHLAERWAPIGCLSQEATPRLEWQTHPSLSGEASVRNKGTFSSSSFSILFKTMQISNYFTPFFISIFKTVKHYQSFPGEFDLKKKETVSKSKITLKIKCLYCTDCCFFWD